MMVDVYRDSVREFRWRIIASNGRIVGDCGEGYKNKGHCVDMATRIAHGDETLVHEVFRDNSGEFRWHVKTRNGRIVGDCGEGYKRRKPCQAMSAKIAAGGLTLSVTA